MINTKFLRYDYLLIFLNKSSPRRTGFELFTKNAKIIKEFEKVRHGELELVRLSWVRFEIL
jgi:hypothetical protein